MSSAEEIALTAVIAQFPINPKLESVDRDILKLIRLTLLNNVVHSCWSLSMIWDYSEFNNVISLVGI